MARSLKGFGWVQLPEESWLLRSFSQDPHRRAKFYKAKVTLGLAAVGTLTYLIHPRVVVPTTIAIRRSMGPALSTHPDR